MKIENMKIELLLKQSHLLVKESIKLVTLSYINPISGLIEITNNSIGIPFAFYF